MHRLVFGFLLFSSVIAVDLSKFVNRPPEEITNEVVQEFLEEIQNSKTPDEDLADLREFLVNNAKSDEERKVVESMSDMMKAVIGARKVMNIDSEIFPSQGHEADFNDDAQFDVDSFASIVKDFIRKLPNSDTQIDRNGKKYRYVKIEVDEREKESQRLALDYYQLLNPNEERPLFVTDEILKTILAAAKSADHSDPEKQRAADEFRDTIAFLENGMKRVYISDEQVDEDGLQKATNAKDSEEQKTEGDPVPESLDGKANDFSAESEVQYPNVDVQSGRRYRLVQLNEQEKEEEAARITLDYYHSLFPDEEKPLIVTEKINEKLFAFLKSTDFSNRRKTKAQNTFQEEVALLQKGLRKEYIPDDEPIEEFEHREVRKQEL